MPILTLQRCLCHICFARQRMDLSEEKSTRSLHPLRGVNSRDSLLHPLLAADYSSCQRLREYRLHVFFNYNFNTVLYKNLPTSILNLYTLCFHIRRQCIGRLFLCGGELNDSSVYLSCCVVVALVYLLYQQVWRSSCLECVLYCCN